MTGTELTRIAHSAIATQLAALRAGRCHIRIPSLEGRMKVSPGGPRFHMYPEMFVQLSGVTDFNFPAEHWRLMPGEVCVMPAGVPHGERVKPWRGRPFHNLVFMFVGPFLYFHMAFEFEEARGYPGVQVAHGFQGMPVLRMAEYLKDAVDAYHSKDRHRNTIFRGLMEAHFGVLLTVLESVWSPYTADLLKITRARELVASRLGNKELCVKQLAEWIGCAPDYLSFLFHKETGKALHAFITEQRLIKAMHMLEDPANSIGDIADAVGYSDPNYFSRLFRQVTGQTASLYRSGISHIRAEYFPHGKPA